VGRVRELTHHFGFAPIKNLTFSMIREPTINRAGCTPSLFQGGLGWVKVSIVIPAFGYSNEGQNEQRT
jgi:hypothetical protein